MSWICRNCETENPDALDVCEVCDASRIYAEKLNAPNLPINLSARYYIWGRNRSLSGKDLMVTRIPRGSLVRKMLTEEWIPIEQFIIPKPKISPTSYYYVWGMKGVYTISQIRAMRMIERPLIREMLTDVWFPLV